MHHMKVAAFLPAKGPSNLIIGQKEAVIGNKIIASDYKFFL